MFLLLVRRCAQPRTILHFAFILLPCSHSTIDDEFRAGHVRRFVARQKQDDIRDFLRPSLAPEWYILERRLALILRDYIDHLRRDRPRMHRVHPYLILGVMDRRNLREQPYGPLAAGVGRRWSRPHQARDRRDVDDRASAAPAHRGYRRPHAEPYALLIDIHDRVPQLFADVLDSRSAVNPRVIDEYVESAELALACFDRAAPIRRARDVEMDRRQHASSRLDVHLIHKLRSLIVQNVANDNSCTFLNE